MSKLFDDCDSDNEVDIKTNNNYAKTYDNWRQKEEFNKLKTKYGNEVVDLDDDSSSSSDNDDDDGAQLTEEVEKEFFKTLSSLKNKDPRIYDTNVTFFKDLPDVIPNKKKTQDRPVYIKDYERNMILENAGWLSDSETENETSRLPTYVEEQHNLKESFKDALQTIVDDDEAWGGMFKTREKTSEEEKQDEDEYKQWLLGQKEQISDKETETDLKPLKDYWSNPQLGENEKFLRDYILNKGFLTKDNLDHIPTYHEIVRDSEEELSEDETEVAKQEEFEYKYNYRFEEPDQEFIKRYPRTMENSLRKVDDRRKIKRAEVKERKQKDKELKMAELKQMQVLKKKEIEEKISKLKQITGSTNVAFDDQDIDGDFDPELHDKRMEQLFDGEFYGGAEGDQKPEFPDLDEELEIENWEKCDVRDQSEKIEEPHCEDNEFNMDCDYNPSADDDIKTSRSKKKHRRKSKFAKVVSEPKPIFDPTDKSYEKYLDEYYKLDCEDVIGDIPCRFKYRNVTPNNFGLSIEEILLAKDRELNRWCSLKKAVQYRPENVEKYDVVAFDKKGKNDTLKRKLLPSLFLEEEIDVNSSNVCSKEGNTCEENISVEELTVPNNNEQVETSLLNQDNLKKKKKIKNMPVVQNGNNDGQKNKWAKLMMKKSNNSENSMGISDARLTAYGFKPKKFNNKLKYGSTFKKQNM